MSPVAPVPPESAAPRHALVTGASSGIGLAIVERLLADGWQVTGLARRPVPLGHPHLRFVAADLAEPGAGAAALEAVGPLDAFVHAAGVLRTADLGALQADDLAAMWRLHVAAASELGDRLAPTLGAGGRIVLIGSRTSTGAMGKSHYAATKAAMVGLARSWAMELATRGVTVNVIAPGATETPMLTDPARGATPPRLPPIGRFVQPEEIAALAAFLLSPQAGAITGQQITVCGGASL